MLDRGGAELYHQSTPATPRAPGPGSTSMLTHLQGSHDLVWPDLTSARVSD